MASNTAEQLCRAARQLCREVAKLRFGPPVACVYNPLAYAWKPHASYLRTYAVRPVPVVFIGMNPGPFGMVQTGVPFGDVEVTREWLGIEGPVARPPHEHPKRPVLGFDCERREVSGSRLWSGIRAHFGSPRRFFTRHHIVNYCPLAFVEESGRNRTPDKLPTNEREPLFASCDRHLRRVITVLEPRWVVGIGTFAEARVREAVPERLVPRARIGRISHPSPANPRAQRDWAGLVRGELEAMGLCREGGKS